MLMNDLKIFSIGLRAGIFPQYSSDAAFVTAKGIAAAENDRYWNTTTKKVREYDGTAWRDMVSTSTPSNGSSVYCSGMPVRASTTQIRLDPTQTGVRNILDVNGEDVDLDTQPTCNVSGGSVVHTISSTGADSGVNPSASTLYNIYMSNSSVGYAPSSLRLCLTNPTDGYLGSTGDAASWRHVGAVYLNSSTQIGDTYNIAGYERETTNKLVLAANITRNTGGAGWYAALEFPNVVIMPKMTIAIDGGMYQAYTSALSGQDSVVLSTDITIDGTEKSLCTVMQIPSLSLSLPEVMGSTFVSDTVSYYTSSSPTSITIQLRYYYGFSSDTLVVYAANRTYLNLSRSSE